VIGAKSSTARLTRSGNTSGEKIATRNLTSRYSHPEDIQIAIEGHVIRKRRVFYFISPFQIEYIFQGNDSEL